MKCVKLVGPKKLVVDEIEEPSSKQDRVIIEVEKTGICGSDLHFWEMGQMNGLVLGHEFSGVVLDCGNRKDLKIGDRVTALPYSPCGKCEGCLKGKPQYCSEIWANATGLSINNPGGLTKKISVRSDMVIKLPDSVSFEEGAMVEPAAVSLHSVHLSNIKIGDNVLVIGAGIIGLTTAMFAKMAGANSVTILETNEMRGNKTLKLNVADEFIDAKNQENINNNLNKYDVVFDCCGNGPTITSALSMVKAGGEIILSGISVEPVNVPMVLSAMKEVSIKGVDAYEINDFNIVISLLESKKIDLMKFVDAIVSFNEVQSSYERLYSSKDDAVKILIDPKK